MANFHSCPYLLRCEPRSFTISFIYSCTVANVYIIATEENKSITKSLV